jgi:hypothetical protein
MAHPLSLVGQGKKIGDNLCGRDDSCDQHYRATQQIRRKQVAATGIVNSSLDFAAIRQALFTDPIQD